MVRELFLFPSGIYRERSRGPPPGLGAVLSATALHFGAVSLGFPDREDPVSIGIGLGKLLQPAGQLLLGRIGANLPAQSHKDDRAGSEKGTGSKVWSHFLSMLHLWCPPSNQFG